MMEPQNSSKDSWALAAELAEAMTANFESMKDEWPPKVEEARRVLIRLCELLSDRSNIDKTVEEAIFAELPAEEVEWAHKVLMKWNDEQRRKLQEFRHQLDEPFN